LSPVSIWEARHLVRRKRLHIKQSFRDWLEMVLARVPIKEAPFNFVVAAEAAGIELPELDPGDVFLAATASAFRLTLVTADSQFAQFKGCSRLKTMANN
jgi:PIN domain nuclease of toxin-antitoxin system